MAKFDDVKILQQKKITVEKLTEVPLNFEKVTGSLGMENEINDKNINRPQLALAGYVGLFNFKQVQILGNTEFAYLKSLSKEDRISAFEKITEYPIPCMVLTNNHKLEPDLLNVVKKKNTAVLRTPYETNKVTYMFLEYLDDQFAPQCVFHGSFVDVYGVGILFTGRSGIGKSEIALDLVERGHRLVADDVVMLTKKRESILIGTGTSLVKHFMEIRGLGIIDLRQMFGIRSIRFQKRLEIVVELMEWVSGEEYTRTGLDEQPEKILGVDVSFVKLPIFPGKNITVIAETIAIHYLLRTYGYHTSKVFSDNLSQEIMKNKGPKSAFQDQRYISYFQSDSE
ncbi:MAG: HPr(Ser) kinase/phosphatase [FCB group bacterium]|jgi:HPr kinase/phosphorylase